MKDKLDEKEEQCQKLEMEVVGLRKTIEKSNACVKFRNNSIIFDKILDSRTLPFDKSGLGYNSGKEKSVVDTWTPSKYEACPLLSKYEIQATPHIPTKDIRKPGGYRRVSLTPQSKFRKDSSSRWNQTSRYECTFNCYYY